MATITFVFSVFVVFVAPLILSFAYKAGFVSNFPAAADRVPLASCGLFAAVLLLTLIGTAAAWLPQTLRTFLAGVRDEGVAANARLKTALSVIRAAACVAFPLAALKLKTPKNTQRNCLVDLVVIFIFFGKN